MGRVTAHHSTTTFECFDNHLSNSCSRRSHNDKATRQLAERFSPCFPRYVPPCDLLKVKFHQEVENEPWPCFRATPILHASPPYAKLATVHIRTRVTGGVGLMLKSTISISHKLKFRVFECRMLIGWLTVNHHRIPPSQFNTHPGLRPNKTSASRHSNLLNESIGRHVLNDIVIF